MKVERNGQAEIFSAAQLATVLGELRHPHRLIFALCYYTSCRISEAVALQAGDIQSGQIVFRAQNTKAKRTKEVSIPAKLQAALDAVDLPESGYLFPARTGATGSHITTKSCDLALHKVCDYIGVQGVSTHSFRRTSITNLYRAGVDLKTIQQRSGHASISNVGLYIQALDGKANLAGELL